MTDERTGRDRAETTRLATVRAYYRALDARAYDDLADLLAPGFVQERPDRTFEGRDAFVSFMRDERPRRDTVHELSGVYLAVDGAEDAGDGGNDAGDPGANATGTGRNEVAVRGRVVGSDRTVVVRFLDVHTLDDRGRIERLVTYTR